MINLSFLKSKKGMTLVELLVGCALLSVLTAIVILVFVPMINMQIKVKELAELNGLLDNLANPIVKDISHATSCGITDNEIKISIYSPEDVIYTVDSDGVLLRNNNPVYSKSFYNKKSVEFICKKLPEHGEYIYVLTVIILSDADGNPEMISRDYTIKPLILNQYNT